MENGPGEWGQQTLFPPAVSFLESWFPALLFMVK